VTVAKSFDAPIKLLFPRQFPTESTKMLHSMLGLGDIVIPGAEKRNCGDTPHVNVWVRRMYVTFVILLVYGLQASLSRCSFVTTPSAPLSPRRAVRTLSEISTV
jgi:hypothetical protein